MACIQGVTSIKNLGPDSTAGCISGFGCVGGYVDKALEIKIRFQYKLYFIQNSHNDVILTTQYNLWLNQLAVFCRIRRCVGLQKHLSVFRHLHKIAPRFDHRLYFFLGGVDYIGKALKTKIKFNYKLCFYSNTFNSCIQKQNTIYG